MNAPIRSFLFVPGDSERKIEKAGASGADALVLDLEDSVVSTRKQYARDLVAAYLKSAGANNGTVLWVRINSLETADALLDLTSIVAGRPAGILLPKAESPHDVIRVGHYLEALEARDGAVQGSTRVVAVATETPGSPFTLGQYQEVAPPRLYGLTWGAEDLSAAIGATTNTDADGRLSLTYRVVRSMALLAAKAAGVDAIDTVYPDFRDLEGFRRVCETGRKDGFSGCFAIHPAQVEVINEAYSPGPSDIAYAERVVAAFDATPDAGAVGLDGKMLDRPHLKQALKILALRVALGRR